MDEITKEARRRILVEKEMARLRAKEAMPKYVVLCGLVVALLGFLLSTFLLEYLEESSKKWLAGMLGFGMLVGGAILLLYGATLFLSGKTMVREERKKGT